MTSEVILVTGIETREKEEERAARRAHMKPLAFHKFIKINLELYLTLIM
jgi:hypothetical protein